MEIKAYRRENGKIGVRNKVLILPTVVCSSETARILGMRVPGAVVISNHLGCGQIGADARRTIDTLIGFASNPNVFAVLVVGLGCETAQPHIILEGIRKNGIEAEAVVIQKLGGVTKCLEKGEAILKDFLKRSKEAERSPCRISDLLVALECGGSDPTSGLAANPVMGAAVDELIAAGGTAILSETTEFIGAEHILAGRAVNSSVNKDIIHIVKNIEQAARHMGSDIKGGNPSPGNIASGITTLEEKSLGCIYKGGKTPPVEVIEYGRCPLKKGLVIMDSPGMDIDSITGMVASGAQISVFSTGLGTPVGNPLIPVIKMTGNPQTYAFLGEHIDFNAGEALEFTQSIEELGHSLFEMIIRISEGEETKAEGFGFSEFSIWRVGPSF